MSDTRWAMPGWLGENHEHRVRQIQDGSLRMVVVFGTYQALHSWRDSWDRLLIGSGAEFRHVSNGEYRWPTGTWLRLEVASSGDAYRIRGIVFTDYEMDASVRYKDAVEWRRLLDILRRR